MKTGDRVKHKVTGEIMTVKYVMTIWVACTLDKPYSIGKLFGFEVTSRICHNDNLVLLTDSQQLKLF